jgi:ribosomal protein S10
MAVQQKIRIKLSSYDFKLIGKSAEKIVETAKPVLKAAWEGVKNVGRSIVSGVKNFFESIFG